MEGIQRNKDKNRKNHEKDRERVRKCSILFIFSHFERIGCIETHYVHVYLSSKWDSKGYPVEGAVG